MTQIGPLSSMHGLGPIATLEVIVRAYAHMAAQEFALEYSPSPCAAYTKMLAAWATSWGPPLEHPNFHAAQKLFREVFA